MAAVAGGDELALHRLYDRYAGLLFHIAGETSCGWEAAEEVVQDVFLQCWFKADTYRDDRGSVSGWLVSMARNRAIDYLRRESADKRGARRTVPLDIVAGMVSGNGDHPGARLERGELAEAWQALSQDQRTAILLAVHGGFTQTEIAQVLGEPLGTVKSWIRRGMLRLRMELVAIGRRNG